MCFFIQVRRLPGFGEVPLRLPSATVTLSDSDAPLNPVQTSTASSTSTSTSKLKTSTDISRFISVTKTTQSHSGPSTSSVCNQHTHSKNKSHKTNGASSNAASAPNGLTNSLTVGGSYTAPKSRPEVIALSSDSDDDILLYTGSRNRPDIQSAKRKNRDSEIFRCLFN